MKSMCISSLPLAAALMGAIYNTSNDGGTGGGHASTFSPDLGGNGGVTNIKGGGVTSGSGSGGIVDTGGSLDANKARVRVPGSTRI